MTQMTITEALAEIKTVTKRIVAKRDFVNKYLLRSDSLKDPLEKSGGSPKALAEELQAIGDLEQRIVDLRKAIQYANDNTALTIEGREQTISSWLIWRREVSKGQQMFLASLRSAINNARDYVRKNQSANAEKPLDIVVHVDEKSLSEKYEKNEKILGQLDGLLSLKNATVLVNINDPTF